MLWGIGGALAALAALFCLFLLAYGAYRLLWEFGWRVPWFSGGDDAFAAGTQRTDIGPLLAVMAVAAAGEEFAFRGVLLPRLRRLTGRWWVAIVICSLLFGAMHWEGGVSHVAATALLSVVLCVVFIRGRSLLAASAAHFLYNVALGVLGRLTAGA